jgi:hypothetical protein
MFHLLEIPRIGKSKDSKKQIVGYQGMGKRQWEGMLNNCGVYLGNNENVLEPHSDKG